MSRQTVSPDFIRQLEGYGVTTVEILYGYPDYPSVLAPKLRRGPKTFLGLRGMRIFREDQPAKIVILVNYTFAISRWRQAPSASGR